LAVLGKNISLEGFLLSNWLRDQGIWSKLSNIKRARALIEEVVVNKSFGLHQIHEAMAEYKANMAKGKVLLKPSLTE
jgi:NADPH:quinone reductase-like Zn-dependent oxidoreductase